MRIQRITKGSFLKQPVRYLLIHFWPALNDVSVQLVVRLKCVGSESIQMTPMLAHVVDDMDEVVMTICCVQRPVHLQHPDEEPAEQIIRPVQDSRWDRHDREPGRETESEYQVDYLSVTNEKQQSLTISIS